MDILDSLLIQIYLEHAKPRLSHRIYFQIQVSSKGTNIFRCMVDEGTSTCVMYLSCWKALGSLELVLSSTILQEFDARPFKPHGIIMTFLIELKGKIVEVEVEFFNAPVDYNLLLGHN